MTQRILVVSLVLLLVLPLTGVAARPAWSLEHALGVWSGMTAAAPLQVDGDRSGTPTASQVPFFGMNTYFTNPSRGDSEVDTLIPMAQSIQTRVVREQISWATYGTGWGPGFFDDRLLKLANGGFEVIGILVTTPEAYSTAECKACADAQGMPRYFCPPANPADFAAYAAEVVERYDGDGYQDATGSPRVAYWEVWNEPDQKMAWVTCSGHNDPTAYAALLAATYPAVKQADPTATVLFGGMSDWDTVGLDDFAENVVAAGGWPYFDVMSFHPFILGYSPEEPGEPWNFPSRLEMVQDWLASHGGGKEAWATEFGWSTCTPPGGECGTEEEQANYMVRAYGLLADKGFAHGSYFHLKDLAGGMGTPYQECALLRPDYSAKPAYGAYDVMTTLLGTASYNGHGLLYDVYDTENDRYDLRFRRSDGTWINLLWKVQGSETVSFVLEPGVLQATLYDRDGNSQTLTPTNGRVSFIVAEQPKYLVRRAAGTVYEVFLPLVVH